MAEFHTRKGIVFHLDRIIDEAAKELVLISPYIKADDETKELLKDKTRRTAIHVLYGKKELNKKEQSFFESLGIKTSFLKDLHAKCYLNENEALLTSMNLYKYSQEHNDEMGILVSKEGDEELYNAIYKQAKRWIGDDVENPPAPKALAPSEGFCIRCGDTVRANPYRPYCERCFKSWNRFKNETYGEKGCHTCGKEHEATMSRPLCLTCYRKHKNWVDSTIK